MRSEEAIAGFPSARPEGRAVRWVNDCSMLTGASGVALALLAAVAEDEPAWDRMLLVDLPTA
jgi:hypothetical protein